MTRFEWNRFVSFAFGLKNGFHDNFFCFEIERGSRINCINLQWPDDNNRWLGSFLVLAQLVFNLS